MTTGLRSLLACYARFCVVGVSGLVVDMSLLVLLHHGLGWPVVPAKLVAAETALVSNFWWNEVWTFRGRTADPGGWRSRLLGFHLICLLGIALSLGMIHGMVSRLGWAVWLANLVAILTASVWNFGLNWLWVGRVGVVR